MSIAVACASGSFRTAFTFGVLSALEKGGLRAAAYSGVSASAIPAALAAVGALDHAGVDYLQAMLAYKRLGRGMSGVALESIAAWGPFLRERLFQPGMSRFCVPVSAVVTPDAADRTQGKEARRLGRQLLLDAARHDRSWAAVNLRLELFDTAADDPNLWLTPDNFDEVAYASTRMLHAWDVPAWIGRRAYIDGSYTCACPAPEMAEAGYDEVIAIVTDPGPVYHDLFATEQVPAEWNDALIHVIAPEVDPRMLGVDFTDATQDGLLALYGHGQTKGREFMMKISR